MKGSSLESRNLSRPAHAGVLRGRGLRQIETVQGSTAHLKLNYPSYQANGLLKQVSDLRDSAGVLSNAYSDEAERLVR
jgi:hypothetical protein